MVGLLGLFQNGLGLGEFCLGGLELFLKMLHPMLTALVGLRRLALGIGSGVSLLARVLEQSRGLFFLFANGDRFFFCESQRFRAAAILRSASAARSVRLADLGALGSWTTVWCSRSLTALEASSCCWGDSLCSVDRAQRRLGSGSSSGVADSVSSSSEG